ncbi:MAG: glycosyltransferase family 2 protein [Gammaproteobacteria bacterium]|nr:glycosyltransferase family 2 protein [Gammaproteobacteria bacterium]
MKNQIDISVIIPMYNESEVLPICYERVSTVLNSLNRSYEIVFVDDGSRDDSATIVRQLTNDMPSIKLVSLSRNFGKEAALTAGIDYVSGSAVIIIDADLQDPPELIPAMVEAWEREDVDVVLMRRKSREGESIVKKITAFLFYRILNLISDFSIPTDTGDFRLMSRKAIEAVKDMPERNRYMKGILSWVGMDTVIIEYDRPTRVAGTVQQNYFRLLGLAIQGITSFSIAPLRFAIFLGLVSATLGASYGVWIIIKAVMWGDAVQGYPSMIAIITFLSGTQLFTIGILGEYVGKTYIESKQRPNYLVKKVDSSTNLQSTENKNEL